MGVKACPYCKSEKYYYKYINFKEILRCEVCGYFEYTTLLEFLEEVNSGNK